MRALAPLLLFGLAGILAGGAFSLRRQGTAWPIVVGVAAAATLAAVGGVFWLLPAR